MGPPIGKGAETVRLFRRERGRRPEDDVPLDTAVAWWRGGGGVPDPDQPDQASTTGTTPSGGYVGRIAGDDVGAFEESGAERRAAALSAAAAAAAASAATAAAPATPRGDSRSGGPEAAALPAADRHDAGDHDLDEAAQAERPQP